MLDLPVMYQEGLSHKVKPRNKAEISCGFYTFLPETVNSSVHALKSHQAGQGARSNRGKPSPPCKSSSSTGSSLFMAQEHRPKATQNGMVKTLHTVGLCAQSGSAYGFQVSPSQLLWSTGYQEADCKL